MQITLVVNVSSSEDFEVIIFPAREMFLWHPEQSRDSTKICKTKFQDCNQIIIDKPHNTWTGPHTGKLFLAEIACQSKAASTSVHPDLEILISIKCQKIQT
jgi:hypothetical protein